MIFKTRTFRVVQAIHLVLNLIGIIFAFILALSYCFLDEYSRATFWLVMLLWLSSETPLGIGLDLTVKRVKKETPNAKG